LAPRADRFADASSGRKPALRAGSGKPHSTIYFDPKSGCRLD